MKLAELGLKTKPETKYFAGGYVSFSTSEKELFYEIHVVGRTYQGLIGNGKVKDREHLDALLLIKKPADTMRFLQ